MQQSAALQQSPVVRLFARQCASARLRWLSTAPTWTHSGRMIASTSYATEAGNVKFLAPSDTTNCTLRDGHSYSFTKPSNRIKAPAYGNANRTVGQTVDVTCQSCIDD